MNAHATTGIRELTAQELDQVTGGRESGVEIAMSYFINTLAIGGAIAGLLEWLFG